MSALAPGKPSAFHMEALYLQGFPARFASSRAFLQKSTDDLSDSES